MPLNRHNTQLPQQTISISQASVCDLPLLTSIHVSAFERDNAVRLLFKGNGQAKAVMDMLQTQINDPSYYIWLAKMQPSGDIVGWLGCNFLNHKGPKPQESDESEAKDQDQAAFQNKATAETKTGEPDPATDLASFIHGSCSRMRNKWVSGKCFYINTLVTEPIHERKGVASALVQWVTARADRDKAFAFVQSSPAAYQLYARLGFNDMDHFDIDLSEFAPGGKAVEQGCAVYRFRYMLRAPARGPSATDSGQV